MVNRTYNLRSRKVSPIYTDVPVHQILKGMTFRYNTYENLGEITRLIDKANIRYGDKSVIQNIEEFLLLYKEYISNYEILIWRLYDIHEPVMQDSLSHICNIIQETLSSKVKECRINDKMMDEKNINENYLILNKLFYAMKDYVLLLVKHKSQKGADYFPDENRMYNLINESINKIYEKYKKHKQSDYDRQKVPMLYNYLPTDVCKYVIKEFL